MAPPGDTRKRKACSNCTHSKAKCTPAIQRPDICERCHRLGKNCVYLDSVRRKGPPRTRSRVQQLEQKVENLMNILALSNEQRGPSSASPNSSTSKPATTECMSSQVTDASSPSNYPLLTPDEDESDELEDDGKSFDVIDHGLLSYASAASFLETFKTNFVPYFPFVAIPQSSTVDVLRDQQPFLFLSIMAVMSHKDAQLHGTLGELVQRQIAAKTIITPHKSFDLLQGLIVYTAWYHFFFRPRAQSLAVIIQICVALVQELGLARNPKEKQKRCVPTIGTKGLPMGEVDIEKSSAEKRAVLGTFYLTVVYAQTWRQRSTMVYSNLMKQWCQSLVDANELPTDCLIKPLVQIQDLSSRVNNYFSYYDVDNAEVQGPGVVEMSTSGFRSELDHIKASIPHHALENPLFKLKLHLLDTWIHEAAIHNDLWSRDAPHYFPLSRISMLWHAVKTIGDFLQAIASYSPDLYYHLPLSIWCGWFYSVMVACKLVFLQEDTKRDRSSGDDTANSPNNVPQGSWDPLSVEKEAHTARVFELMLEKLSPIMAADLTTEHHRTFYHMGLLQRSILTSFRKRISDYEARRAPPMPAPQNPPVTAPDQQPMTTFSDWNPIEAPPSWPLPTNYESNGHFPSDLGSSIPTYYDDMIWDTVVDDFTLPSM